MDALCETLETNEYVHSEKFMDVSDMQVSDKRWLSVSQQYDQREQQGRDRANSNDESRFASKIVLQPLELDTDAQLHKVRVISVRQEAEFAARVLKEKCPRWNQDTLETSCQCDVEEFQEAIKVAQKTVVIPQVPR